MFKRDDFNFEIVNFPFLDRDALAPLPMVYTFCNLVERLPVLHYSVDFIFLSFGIMGFIVEL